MERVTISTVSIDVFDCREEIIMLSMVSTITCKTCKRESMHVGVSTLPPYGTPRFTPMHHDHHCPARNHVYLEGIGPMVEPRAMVMEKTEETNGSQENI